MRKLRSNSCTALNSIYLVSFQVFRLHKTEVHKKTDWLLLSDKFLIALINNKTGIKTCKT